jgi:hypothetical protein
MTFVTERGQVSTHGGGTDGQGLGEVGGRGNRAFHLCFPE